MADTRLPVMGIPRPSRKEIISQELEAQTPTAEIQCGPPEINDLKYRLYSANVKLIRAFSSRQGNK